MSVSEGYYLRVCDLRKRYATEQVLQGCDLELPFGKTLSVLGRSGSGKTTLLKIIAGLEEADSGSVELSGASVDHLPAQRRAMVYLNQEALLFPHLRVWDNIAFGLKIRKLGKAEIAERVEQMLVDIDLQDQAMKWPEQLSGGQRQRVAFARALVIEPRVLLLDEPFGALDSETRGDMQQLFLRIAAKRSITTLFVTHDLKEALIMGEQLAVMEAGRLRLYPSREAFMADERTGVIRERDFWRGLPSSFNV